MKNTPAHRYLSSLQHALRVLTAIASLTALTALPVMAQEQDEEYLPTPPRISMTSGSTSFWRPGADNWSAAQLNTPLAAGDAVYTADDATLELQIGSRAYVRLAQNSMLSLLGDEPNLQQFKMTSGTVAFDVRGMDERRSIEIATPAGAFNIDSTGYYRVNIDENDNGATHFIVRRGGEATVTLADGSIRLVAPGQEVVIENGDSADDIEILAAPDTDPWDEWNTARTDSLIDAVSNRYVAPEVYGTSELDRYGSWRETADYGAVWVPSGVSSGWAPYSSGSWVWDPVYSWTWVDTAPWGWAPYHYGRWVNTGGYWGWAPGPRHHRPRYAPALVAFFHGGGSSVHVNIGGPSVSWVALGWGEPCLPWWGRSQFAGKPWWGGWGGPRVVNNVVIQRNTVVNHITINRTTYRNLRHRDALIGVPERNFGHGRLNGERRFSADQAREFKPIAGNHPMRPASSSLAPTTTRGAAPTRGIENRQAFATRTPQQFPTRATFGRDDRRDINRTPSRAPTSTQNALPDNRVTTVRPQTRSEVQWGRGERTTGAERDEPRSDQRNQQRNPADSRRMIEQSESREPPRQPRAYGNVPQNLPQSPARPIDENRERGFGARFGNPPADRPMPPQRQRESMPTINAAPTPQVVMPPSPPEAPRTRDENRDRGFGVRFGNQAPERPMPPMNTAPPTQKVITPSAPQENQRARQAMPDRDRGFNAPSQTQRQWRQETPREPSAVRPQEQFQRRENPNPRSERQFDMRPREMQQERREPQREMQREMRQREAPSAMPGQSGNQFSGRGQREFNQRGNDAR